MVFQTQYDKMTIHRFTFTGLLLFGLTNCMGQQNTDKMKTENNQNPLACDPASGVCEIPGTANATDGKDLAAKQKPVRIIYFTDPICSSCWGIEPQLRKLKLEYGNDVEVEYHMGGLLPGWDIYNSGGIGKATDVAPHWEEASAYYQMPIDGDVWLEDPLSSSYPPSIAFKAAEMQDKAKSIVFLRRIREMVFLEKKNITKWEHIASAAEYAGLDITQLQKDFEGKAKQLFQEDLELGRKLGVRGFPTLFVSDSLNNQLTVYGFKPYEQFEQAVVKLYPQAEKKKIDVSPEFLFSHYPTLTTKEFAELTGKKLKEAETALELLVKEKKITKFNSKNGPLWKAK